MLSWLRNLITPRKDYTLSRIIQRYKFKYGKLDLVEFDEAGVCSWSEDITVPVTARVAPTQRAVWKINHQSSRCFLYVGLVNMSRLKIDRKRNKSKIFHKEDEFLFTPQLVNSIIKQRGIKSSHVVVTAWIPKLGECTEIKYKDVICCNLIDEKYSRHTLASEDDFAKLVVKDVIKRLCMDIWVPNTNNSTWQSAVETVSVKQWLGVLAKDYLGDDHELQPPRLLEDL